MTNFQSEQLTSNFGVKDTEIDEILFRVNEKLNDWNYLLWNFEEQRSKDIHQVIDSNCRKKKMFDFVSDFVWLNGKSPLKLSELLQTIQKGYTLFSSDLGFIKECLLIVREFFLFNLKLAQNDQVVQLNKQIEYLLDLYKSSFFDSRKYDKKNQIEKLKEIFNSTSITIDSNELIERIEMARDEIKRTSSLHLVEHSKSDVKFTFLIKSIDILVNHFLFNES